MIPCSNELHLNMAQQPQYTLTRYAADTGRSYSTLHIRDKAEPGQDWTIYATPEQLTEIAEHIISHVLREYRESR